MCDISKVNPVLHNPGPRSFSPSLIRLLLQEIGAADSRFHEKKVTQFTETAHTDNLPADTSSENNFVCELDTNPDPGG